MAIIKWSIEFYQFNVQRLIFVKYIIQINKGDHLIDFVVLKIKCTVLIRFVELIILYKLIQLRMLVLRI